MLAYITEGQCPKYGITKGVNCYIPIGMCDKSPVRRHLYTTKPHWQTLGNLMDIITLSYSHSSHNSYNLTILSKALDSFLQQKYTIILEIQENTLTFAIQHNGALAEWLGNGLQNHVQWFDSATHLLKCLWRYSRGICYIKSLLNN